VKAAPADAVVLTYPVEPTGVTKFLHRLASPGRRELRRRFELDAAGAKVWKLCDGAHSVSGIVAFVRDAYDIPREEAEQSCVLYIRMLAERGLLVLDVGERADGE